MIDDSNVDEPISKRRSKRSCRLPNVKSQPNTEKPDVEPATPESNEMEEEIEEEEEEDPEDIFQKGDVFWVRIIGNPWWPALIYGSYYEDNLHTKIVTTARRPKRRRYFVYFFGPDFEYSWAEIQAMVPYSGLEDFMKHAEITIEKANSKKEQELLANRFELKVPAGKRAQWDKALEAADEAIKLTREQRLENFADILKIILNKSNEKKRVSVPKRQSLKKTSSDEKSTNRSSVKRQKTKSTPVSTSTTLLHVGFPILTKKEEEQIVNTLLEQHDQLNLREAQSIACQLVMDLIKENFQVDMTCVQTEWFYDFLLNHRELTSKYSRWFNDDIKPIFDDSISFKQLQLKNLN